MRFIDDKYVHKTRLDYTDAIKSTYSINNKNYTDNLYRLR